METCDRLRVAVTLNADARSWQRAVVDSLRSTEGLDLDTRSPIDPRCEVLVDLAGVAGSEREPPLGVWRYGFGAPLADGAPGTCARLYRATPDPDRVVVLHEGWYRARTNESWGTKSVGDRVAPWAARALRQIQLGGRGLVDRAAQAIAGCGDPEPPEPPTRLHAAGLDAIDTVRSWITRPRWTIGVVPIALEEVMQRGALPEPSWLAAQPDDRFYADPFPLEACADRTRVLAEEYIYPSRTKRLTEIEVGPSGAFRCRRDEALPPHASYPFLLRRNGRLFCLPETSSARRISAFMSDSSAGSWKHYCDLLTGFPFVDATFVEHGESWWMFCTKQGDEDQTDLYLFFAPDWLGPWQPHPLNPVKSDTRSSRPAGSCFTLDGDLYRPAQNCARRYGAGVTINRIVELSPRAFREEPVLSLRPSESSPWPHGMHTINGIGGVTIVDGLRVERRGIRP